MGRGSLMSNAKQIAKAIAGMAECPHCQARFELRRTRVEPRSLGGGECRCPQCRRPVTVTGI